MATGAASTEATSARVLVLDGGQPHDVFEVVEVGAGLVRVRAAWMFEIGEELTVRIEDAGTTTEAKVRVRAHVGPRDALVTELELLA